MDDLHRVVLVIGPRIFRDGLAESIERRGRISVVASVSSAHEALKTLGQCGVDVVLLDIAIDGAADFLNLAVVSGHARVVALAINDSEADVIGWAARGVSGFVTTDDSLEYLNQCVTAVAEGEFICSPRHASMLLRGVATLSRGSGQDLGHEALTPRQLEVLTLLRAGLSNKLIARRLGIELTTVKNHVHQVLHRLNAHSRVDFRIAPSARPSD